jgi:hypothetical protein
VACATVKSEGRGMRYDVVVVGTGVEGNVCNNGASTWLKLICTK